MDIPNTSDQQSRIYNDREDDVDKDAKLLAQNISKSIRLYYAQIRDLSLDDLSKLGNFLGGVGVFGGALAAYYFIRRNENRRQFIDNFRKLYSEFWENEDISIIRRCITNDTEYEALKVVLINRMKNKRNVLSEEENNAIERLDRFCAALVRVKSFSKSNMTIRQTFLWDKLLYGDFWIKRAHDRPELRAYIQKYWPEISKPRFRDIPRIVALWLFGWMRV